LNGFIIASIFTMTILLLSAFELRAY